jgi:hypothetical protein
MVVQGERKPLLLRTPYRYTHTLLLQELGKFVRLAAGGAAQPVTRVVRPGIGTFKTRVSKRNARQCCNGLFMVGNTWIHRNKAIIVDGIAISQLDIWVR